MKNCLLFLAVVAVLAIGAPAHSQYIFLDVNGDGHDSANPLEPGSGSDGLNSGVTSIDVYFDTNHNPDGSTATCDQTVSNNLTINSYEALLRSSGSGSVSYTSWTDNMGYTVNLVIGGTNGFLAGGTDCWIGLGSSTASAPNRYKVGTLHVTVTGTPVLSFLPLGGSSLNANAETAFGTQCEGIDFDNTYKLGTDYPLNHAFGTPAPTPAVSKTWGAIKEMYK